MGQISIYQNPVCMLTHNENNQTHSNFFGRPVLMVKSTNILKKQVIKCPKKTVYFPVNDIYLESLGNKEL